MALTAAAAVLALGACGQVGVRKQAAKDVHALLLAAEAGDLKGFEAHIDRPALRADLKSQLLTLPEIRALQSQLGDDVGDVAADKMISTEAVRVARTEVGARPSEEKISSALKVLDDKRVCLKDPADEKLCVMTFEKRGHAWKLTALHATDLRAQIPDTSEDY